MISLVSSNDERDMVRARAAERVKHHLRALTANLLRVVRGAGKPYFIENQAVELALALQSYRDANDGVGISSHELT